MPAHQADTYRSPHHHFWPVGAGIGLISFLVYLSTLAPTITWAHAGADSGDLATAVAVAGVPHPSGYPTYLALGQLFTLLPVGDIAYRLNLLSAGCAALTIVILAAVMVRTLSAHFTGLQPVPAKILSWSGAGAVGLTFAFSDIFWSQAVITEVYSLNALLAVSLLYLALSGQPANQGWLVPLFFLLLGLSLGNHLSIIFFLPVLFFALKARWNWPLIGAGGLAFFVGLAIYGLIPWRAAAEPPLNWGRVVNGSQFYWLVTAEPYRQYFFALPWPSVPGRIGQLAGLLVETFMGWGVPVGLIGLRRLFHHDRSLGYGTIVTFLLICWQAIGYNTTDSYLYLIPAFLLAAIWVGWGLFGLTAWLAQTFDRRFNPYWLGLVLLILPGLPLIFNYSEQNLRQDWTALTFAEQSLHIVAPDAIIIVENDPQTFALWYGHYALQLRPDVTIVNLNLLAYDWYRHNLGLADPNLRLTGVGGQPITTLAAFVEHHFPARPLYLADLQQPEVAGYGLQPADPLQRLVARPE
jgi:hypothetical protein